MQYMSPTVVNSITQIYPERQTYENDFLNTEDQDLLTWYLLGTPCNNRCLLSSVSLTESILRSNNGPAYRVKSRLNTILDARWDYEAQILVVKIERMSYFEDVVQRTKEYIESRGHFETEDITNPVMQVVPNQKQATMRVTLKAAENPQRVNYTLTVLFTTKFSEEYLCRVVSTNENLPEEITSNLLIYTQESHLKVTEAMKEFVKQRVETLVLDRAKAQLDAAYGLFPEILMPDYTQRIAVENERRSDLLQELRQTFARLQQLQKEEFYYKNGKGSNDISSFLDFIKENYMQHLTNVKRFGNADSKKIHLGLRHLELLYWDEEDYTTTRGYVGSQLNRLSKQKLSVLDDIFIHKTATLLLSTDIIWDLGNISVTALNEGQVSLSSKKQCGLPNPHLYFYRCFGDNENEIVDALRNGNYEIAFLQSLASAQNINIRDGVVWEKFLRYFNGGLRIANEIETIKRDGKLYTIPAYIAEYYKEGPNHE